MHNGRYAKARETLDEMIDQARSVGRDQDVASLEAIKALHVELIDELRGYADPAFWQGRVERGMLYTEAVRDRGRAARAYIRSLGLDAPEPGERPAVTAEVEEAPHA